MDSEAAERFAEHEHTIQLLRDQVDALQIAAAEKRKPWYLQTPSVASLLALLLSVTTFAYSNLKDKRQDVQKKQESLRGIVSAMIDLANEQQAKLGSADSQRLSTQEREFIGGMMNTRRMILAETADNLVRDIPDQVSSSEYNFLANDKLSNGNAAKAEEYLHKAIEVSGEPMTKMIALRNLAFFYAGRGPFQSMNKARQFFQEAVKVVQGEPRDDATAYTLGFTWEMWGTAEYFNGFPAEGAEKIENARKYYQDLSANNPTRNWALLFLDTRMQPFKAPPQGSLPGSSPAEGAPSPGMTPPGR